MLYNVVKKVTGFGIRNIRRFTTDWTQERGQVVLPGVPPAEVPPPGNLDQLTGYEEIHFNKTIWEPERRLYLLDNVRVSWQGVVFRNLRLFEPSVPLEEKPGFQGSFLLRQWWGKKPQVRLPAGEVIGLAHVLYAVGNYYHWLIDSLPRLLLLQRYYPGCQLLVPAPVPGYVRQTAQMFGYEQLVPLEEGAIAVVPRLAMPDYTAAPGRQDAALVKQVRQVILQTLRLTGTTASRRLYVSRGRQPLRRLLNEDVIEPLLQAYGFETVYFEDMNFETQVRTMREAAVLLGVHGANLTNMLFMEPGTAVVELTSLSSFNDCYYCLSASLGITYYAAPCERVEPANWAENTAINFNDNNMDVVADVTMLKQLLTSLFSS